MAQYRSTILPPAFESFFLHSKLVVHAKLAIRHTSQIPVVLCACIHISEQNIWERAWADV